MNFRVIVRGFHLPKSLDSKCVGHCECQRGFLIQGDRRTQGPSSLTLPSTQGQHRSSHQQRAIHKEELPECPQAYVVWKQDTTTGRKGLNFES